MGELTAERAAAHGGITEIELQILQLGATRREEAITQLRDLQSSELELAERRRTLREQLDRLDIRAPVGGIVYDMQIFAERSVIRPAEPVAYIVPQDRPLVIEARVEPIHIDQVYPGQETILRFPAFDARTTPELNGRVLRISADAFTDEVTQAAFYRAEVEIAEGEMQRLPEGIGLIPGMPVETYIRTHDRTPLAYLVSPLTNYFNRAFRES